MAELVPIFTPALFTPAEAEAVSGVDPQNQRAWRMRGHLPTREYGSHSRYDVWGLANLLALRLLGARGGPLLARDIARECAVGIAHNVLRRREAWSGDHSLVGAWDHAWFDRIQGGYRAMREATANLDAEVADRIALVQADYAGPWAEQLTWLRDRLYRECGIETVPQRFFMWWADGSHMFASNVQASFDAGFSDDPRFNGGVTVLDLEAIASSFPELAGRAFIHVDLPGVGETALPHQEAGAGGEST